MGGFVAAYLAAGAAVAWYIVRLGVRQRRQLRLLEQLQAESEEGRAARSETSAAA